MPHRTVFCSLQVLFLLLCLATLPATAQKPQVKKINEQQLQTILHSKTDTLHILNFWATWCKPCIKELPYFLQIAQENKNSNVKVILVSVDFPEDINTRLIPFLERRQLPQPMLLIDPKNDQWINDVSTEWSGAIPATIIFNKHRGIYYFIERELSLQELQKYVSLNKTTKP